MMGLIDYYARQTHFLGKYLLRVLPIVLSNDDGLHFLPTIVSSANSVQWFHCTDVVCGNRIVSKTLAQ